MSNGIISCGPQRGGTFSWALMHRTGMNTASRVNRKVQDIQNTKGPSD